MIQVPGLFKTILALVALGSVGFLQAEKPTLEHIYPAGAGRASTNQITFSGKFEPWPPSFWVSDPGIQIVAETNKGKATLIVGADASPSLHTIRVFNSDGASDPRVFVIGTEAELRDTEPNDHFAKPQQLTNFPLMVNGRLDKNGDVDSFSIPLKGGEWVDARVDCYTLMSKSDAALRLVTAEGEQLTWNHDFASLDPRITWRAERDQTVVLQIFGFAYPANSQIQLNGGEGAVYRLHLRTGSKLPADLAEKPGEQEPNDLADKAATLDLPTTVAGTICAPTDLDRFAVELKKDETLEAILEAASLGSPLDAWIGIENPEGKELKRDDDSDATRDPKLEWKATEDGKFILTAGSVTHRGSDKHRYRLRTRKLEPDFTATVSQSSFVIAPGSTNEIKFNFKRLRGLTNQLTTSLEFLPEEVSAATVELPEKDGEVSLSVIAATNAPAFNGILRLLVTDKTTHKTRSVPVEFTSRTIDNGVPGGYTSLLLPSTDELWLTVTPPKAP